VVDLGTVRAYRRRGRLGVAGERRGAVLARVWAALHTVPHQLDPRNLLRVFARGIGHRRGRPAEEGLTRGGEGRSALVEGGRGVRCRAPGASVAGAHGR
jgi:hypothetical protein